MTLDWENRQSGPALSGVRVLLVEDSVVLQHVIRNLLVESGASVELAGNGHEAVTVVLRTRTPFDVILMDMNMPVMIGCDGVRHLRKRGYRLPIIALTADQECTHPHRCQARGCTDRLYKPVTRDALISTIQNQLHRPSDPAKEDVA